MIFGLIGAGKWGNKILNASKEIGIQLDIIPKNNWKEMVRSRIYDGIIIATQPDSHVEIAKEVLKAETPVMIEKPLALTYEDALSLKEYEHLAPILINHVHLFSPAFQRLKWLVKSYRVAYINSIGTNIGPTRKYSSLFDYAPHDIAMGIYLMRGIKPKVDNVIKFSNEHGENYSIVLGYECKFEFKRGHEKLINSKKIYHYMTAGSAGPKKERKFSVGTADYESCVYDDLAENKLCINGVPEKVRDISTLTEALLTFTQKIESGRDHAYNDDRFGLDLPLKVMEALNEINNLSL